MKKYITIAICALAVAGCTEMRVASHLYKKGTNEPAPYKAPAIKGARKVGNPYTVLGRTYYPIANSDGFQQKGIASWYGKDFHGKATANGEVYNMYDMTAAHPILPIPTYVRVTNLENGRTAVVRINDRGPFARGRVIDLSYRASQVLGMTEQGTAPVLIEALPADGSPLKTRTVSYFPNERVSHEAGKSFDYAHIGNQPTEVERLAQVKAYTMEETVLPEAAPVPAKSHFTRANATLTSSKVFVQTGAFSSLENAQRQINVLGGRFGSTQIMLTEQQGQTLYRVRIGPFITVADADQILEQVVQDGFEDAILAVE